MDIDEFYDADPRRRESDEKDFGTEWQDPDDPNDLWSLHWVEATGELYRMREPKRQYFMPSHEAVNPQRKVKDADLTVEVIGHVADGEAVERILGDWQMLMGQPDGLRTVHARLTTAGDES